MNGVERYLTQKARPRKAIVLLENAAVIAMVLLTTALVYVAVYGYQVDGVSTAHAALAAVELAIVLVSHVLMERKRARKHAELIVRALLMQEEGRIPCDDMAKLTGVRNAAEEAVRLTEKGYLTDVVLRKGFVGLADRMPEEAPEAPVTPIFRN